MEEWTEETDWSYFPPYFYLNSFYFSIPRLLSFTYSFYPSFLRLLAHIASITYLDSYKQESDLNGVAQTIHNYILIASRMW